MRLLFLFFMTMPLVSVACEKCKNELDVYIFMYERMYKQSWEDLAENKIKLEDVEYLRGLVDGLSKSRHLIEYNH